MTATDDRVWSEFGLRTAEEVERLRAEVLAGADMCTCHHYRRDHFPNRCAHTSTRYTPAPYKLPCPCDGFRAASDPMSPGGQESA